MCGKFLRPRCLAAIASMLSNVMPYILNPRFQKHAFNQEIMLKLMPNLTYGVAVRTIHIAGFF
jgi:hypothetical protein